MTPVYLNPEPSSGSFPKEDHHLQLFLSPLNHHLSSSRTGSTSSVTTARDPRASALLLGEPKQHHDRPPKGLQFYERSSGDDQHPISSSPFQPAVNGANNVGHKFESSEIRSEDWEESCGGKWMPSKIRLMQKMTSSTGLSTQAKAAADDDDDKPMKFTLKLQDQRNHVNEISTSSSSSNQTHNTAAVIRVCSDCNTTTTPLWRSGPGGPKSLCNACGIRQRKARRAAAAAAAASGDGTVEASPSSKTNQKLQAHKEKKPRSSHNIGQSKKSCNKPPQNTKFCFKKIALSLSNNSAFQGGFSRDVEEAAILLMELSCGFIQS